MNTGLRRHVIGVLLAALVVAACGGGSDGPSPGEVAVEWRKAYYLDAETRWELSAPDLRGPNKDKAATIARWADVVAPRGGDVLVDVEVVKTVEDDTRKKDFVFVYLRVTDKQGDITDEAVTLRRVDGAWRVAKWEP